MGAAGVLRGRQLAVAGRLPEPLVRSVLVGHQSEVRIRLHGDEAGGEDGGHVAVPAAHVAKILGGSFESFPA